MALRRQIINDMQPFRHVKKQIEGEREKDGESVVTFTQVLPPQCSSSDLEAG